MDLNENQMQWVTNHLGHNMEVHKIHYRLTKTFIEWGQIAKLLLIQDGGVAAANRSLEDITFECKYTYIARLGSVP